MNEMEALGELVAAASGYNLPATIRCQFRKLNEKGVVAFFSWAVHFSYPAFSPS